MQQFINIYPNVTTFTTEMRKYRPFPLTGDIVRVEGEFLSLLYNLTCTRTQPTLYDDSVALEDVRKEFGRRYTLYSWLPLMKFNKIFKMLEKGDPLTDFSIKDKIERTYEDNGTSSNTALTRDAQTPTTNGLSTTYVDDYSDSQSKVERSGTDSKDGTSTDTHSGNVGYWFTQFDKIPKELINSIQDIFRDCFWNFLNDLDDLDDF